MKKFIQAIREYKEFKKYYRNSSLIYRPENCEYEVCLFSEQTVNRIKAFNFITNKPI